MCCLQQDVAGPLCENSLLILGKSTRIRRVCITLIHWRLFELLALVAIIANCITLAMDRCAHIKC